MPDVSTNAEKAATSEIAEGPALDARYGRIGISAVAAAARYQGTAKNPAYAPTSTHWRDQFAGETV
jgi:hypothetical protein